MSKNAQNPANYQSKSQVRSIKSIAETSDHLMPCGCRDTRTYPTSLLQRTSTGDAVGTLSVSAIAKRFGIAWQTADAIIKRKKWSHVTDQDFAVIQKALAASLPQPELLRLHVAAHAQGDCE